MQPLLYRFRSMNELLARCAAWKNDTEKVPVYVNARKIRRTLSRGTSLIELGVHKLLPPVQK